MVYVCAELYNITRRGLACVAYPYDGAMREPDYRDRRGGTISHVFFVSINLREIMLMRGMGRGMETI